MLKQLLMVVSITVVMFFMAVFVQRSSAQPTMMKAL